MKSLIYCSAISCFVSVTVLFGSCSDETPALQAKSTVAKVEKDEPKQQSPKMLVQQFGGCKAHQ
ncbi:MAG: hypothetical protein V4604_03030 [Bacteroidota bacterium]